MFDSESGRKAGQKSKRTKVKTPHELKVLLAEGSLERVPKLWEALDALLADDKKEPKQYMAYLIKILQLVVPKDLNIEGEIDVDGGDAKRKLIERLLARAGETSDKEDGK